MANGTGLDASFGFALETTYGTTVTPTRWLEFQSDSLKRVRTVTQGKGLRAGGLYMRGNRRREATRHAAGNLNLELSTTGMGQLLQLIFGASTNTAGSGATAGVYTQVHTPASLLGKSATVQIARPSSTDQTINPFTYIGTKVVDAMFSLDNTKNAELVLTLDSKDELTLGTASVGPALATPTLSTTANAFSFRDGAITLGGTSIAAVRKFDVKMTRAQKVDRYFIGSGALKAEPLANAFQTVSGTMDAEFVSRSALHDAFASDAPLALVFTLTSPLMIASTAVPFSFSLTIPQIRLDGDTPPVAGPDVLVQAVPFQGLDDGTNPVVTATYVTSDTSY